MHMVMNIFRKKREQDGFTLLELLVSLTILAVGLLAAASMQGIAMNQDSIANNNSVASMLAMQVEEDILSSNTSTLNQYGLYCQPPTCPTSCNISYKFYSAITNTTSSQITVPGSGTYSAKYSVIQFNGACPEPYPYILEQPLSNTTTTGTAIVQVIVSRLTSTNSSFFSTRYTTQKRVQ